MLRYEARPLAGGNGTCLNNNGDVGGESNLRGTFWFNDGSDYVPDWSPNVSFSSIEAINDSRVAVGYQELDGVVNPIYPIIVRDRRIVDLRDLIGSNVFCSGINNSGLICGCYLHPTAPFGVTGFIFDLFQNAVVATLQPPDGLFIFPGSMWINDAGDVIMVCVFDQPPFPPLDGYVHRAGVWIPLQSGLGDEFRPIMNSTGKAVGFGNAAFIDTQIDPPTQTTLPLPPGCVAAETRAINDDGVIVGVCWRSDPENDDTPNPPLCFQYDPATGRSTLLGRLIDPPGFRQELPLAINNVGQILTDHAILTPGMAPPNFDLRILAQILTGVEADSGGLQLVDGHLVRVPPRDNGSGWALAPEVRDALIGLAVNQIASQITDATGRGTVGRTGLELAHSSIARMLAAPAAPKAVSRSFSRRRLAGIPGGQQERGK
jgi:hypothetical protein